MASELNEVTCAECGIEFSFSTKIEKLWRKSGKTFYCPSGHTLHWAVEVETPEKKELEKLRVEVKDLKSKLEVAMKDAESQKKKSDELTLELEIWKPASKEN